MSKADLLYWLIDHRQARGGYTLFRGLSPGYPLFVRCFLGWKRDNILWPGEKAAFTLSFDCDYESDVKALPQLLSTLDKHKTAATFACVGKWVETFPDIHRQLVTAGHEILNHTYSHPDNEELDPDRRFNELSRSEKQEQIEKCHRACKELLGYEPLGFRTPHFGRLFAVDDYDILRQLGYRYSSSTLALLTPENGQPFPAPAGIIEFPLSPCPRHPFAVFDSWHTTSDRTPGSVHRSAGDFYRRFRELVDIAIATRSYINVYFDPQDIVKVSSFSRMLQYLNERQDEIQVTTYRQLYATLQAKMAPGSRADAT